MNHKVCAYFILMLFHARTDAHLMHLKSRSYSEHMALNGFYDALPDLVDSFTEAYQGKYGLIENYPDFYTPLKSIDDLLPAVESIRGKLPQDSELQNIVDEIVSLIDSTIYKLRFLK